MSVKLRTKKNATGTVSQYLDIYHPDGKREYLFFRDLILDGKNDKQKKLEAKARAVAKEHELNSNDYRTHSTLGRKVIVSVWMQTFIDRYKKKDKRNLQGALNRFNSFLLDNKLTGLTFGRITETMIEEYRDYLKETSEGEGAASYFARFKKMMKQAKKDKLIPDNPAEAVKAPGGKPGKKDTLTLEEIQVLANTPTESTEVKKAALFSCVTGFAWIDVKELLWDHINLQAGTVCKMREKNNGEVEPVYINLNDTAKKILGNPENPKGRVFNLPTANGCNKTVKAWVKRAGIQKKITWHNFRHSFGTNLVFLGADLISASELLGHTSLKHTQRYVKAANEMKQRATDKLNIQL